LRKLRIAHGGVHCAGACALRCSAWVPDAAKCHKRGSASDRVERRVNRGKVRSWWQWGTVDSRAKLAARCSSLFFEIATSTQTAGRRTSHLHLRRADPGDVEARVSANRGRSSRLPVAPWSCHCTLRFVDRYMKIATDIPSQAAVFRSRHVSELDPRPPLNVGNYT
jgi:hypothetical protein